MIAVEVKQWPEHVKWKADGVFVTKVMEEDIKGKGCYAVSKIGHSGRQNQTLNSFKSKWPFLIYLFIYFSSVSVSGLTIKTIAQKTIESPL